LRKDKEDHKEANDVKKKEEEMSLASNMVKKLMDENMRGCEHMINKRK